MVSSICTNRTLFHQPRFHWNSRGSHFPSKKRPFGGPGRFVRSRANLTRFNEEYSNYSAFSAPNNHFWLHCLIPTRWVVHSMILLIIENHWTSTLRVQTNPSLEWFLLKDPIPSSRYGCFLKWWYPQNTPKWSFLVGKRHGCWVNPPFSETPISQDVRPTDSLRDQRMSRLHGADVWITRTSTRLTTSRKWC